MGGSLDLKASTWKCAHNLAWLRVSIVKQVSLTPFECRMECKLSDDKNVIKNASTFLNIVSLPFDVLINDYAPRLFMKGVNLSLGHTTKRLPFVSLMNICVNNDNLMPIFTMCYCSNFSSTNPITFILFSYFFLHEGYCIPSQLLVCLYIDR